MIGLMIGSLLEEKLLEDQDPLLCHSYYCVPVSDVTIGVLSANGFIDSASIVSARRCEAEKSPASKRLVLCWRRG